MTTTLATFPIWPCVVLFLVICCGSALLFMMGCASHRRDWCYDCHERCDGHVWCRCCGGKERET